MPPAAMYEHRLRVRYAETDAMGVAHHAAYLIWMEAARVEWIRAIGFPFADVEATGYGHAVRQVAVLYRRPARFDQLLSLQVALTEARGPRLRYGYRLFDATELDGERAGGAPATPIALGRIEVVWVTPDGRPTRLPGTHPLSTLIAGLERRPEWDEW